MKRTLSGLALALAALSPFLASAAGADAALVKRGEYLARAADCMACHTAEGGAPFAGGLPIQSPFGTIYGTNITPDKEHGMAPTAPTSSSPLLPRASARTAPTSIRRCPTPPIT